MQPAPAGQAGSGGLGTAVVLVGIVGICLSGPLLLVGGLLAPVGVLALALAAGALFRRRG